MTHDTRDALDRRHAIGLLAACLALAVLIGLALPVHAQNAGGTQAVTHQTVSAQSGTPAGLSANTTSGAGLGQVSFCVGTVEGSPLRFWMDGTLPGPGAGHYVGPGGQFVLPSYQTAAGFQMVPDAPAGGQSVAQVECFRGGAPTLFISAFDPTLTASKPAPPTVPTLPLPACSALVRTNCK